MRNFELKLAVLFLAFLHTSSSRVEAKCSKGCDLALASYYLWNGVNLTFISRMFDTSIENIQSFNPQITDRDKILAGTRINVPFSCNCIQKQFLGYTFSYLVKSGNTYEKIAELIYANLTTVDWLKNTNVYDENQAPDVGTRINVIVKCSCGKKSVSKDYGLFVTYPLREGENLTSVVDESEIPSDLLQSYNPTSNFSGGSGLIFFPGKDQTGNYPVLKIGTGISSGIIAGISIGGVASALVLAFWVYVGLYRRKKVAEASYLPEALDELYIHHGSGSTLEEKSESAARIASTGLSGITVDRSVEFSYEELAKATDNFSMANKIGQGGFGAVFYAELRGEKTAIKKMDMQASKEFLAELKVLTHVHHLNLVRLIGYCVEGSLFLVYEYVENGTLNQHLRGMGKDPLPWSARMQIALDSARGLEYIHEHTIPVYIHRDIKSANILIDKNFRAKVADFGLTKLTECGSASVHTRLLGTFGYMPPEYAHYGEVSPKIDVYAFGVVLYELISAKEAVVKANETITKSTGLVALFEDVLHGSDPKEDLRILVDPGLGDNYPLDSVHGSARQILYARKSSIEAKHEGNCSCAYDTVIINSGLGCWLILRKSRSSQSNVGAVTTISAPMKMKSRV